MEHAEGGGDCERLIRFHFSLSFRTISRLQRSSEACCIASNIAVHENLIKYIYDGEAFASETECAIFFLNAHLDRGLTVKAFEFRIVECFVYLVHRVV